MPFSLVTGDYYLRFQEVSMAREQILSDMFGGCARPALFVEVRAPLGGIVGSPIGN